MESTSDRAPASHSHEEACGFAVIGGMLVIRWAIYAMVYLGSALMVYNIYGFVRFARFIRGRKSWNRGGLILNLPIALLVCFLLGYLAVGIFGKPDIIIAGILLGGSVFVFVMYKLLISITQKVIENEHLEAQMLAVEESNRVKSGILASISHEMRTPMNVILGLNAKLMKDHSLSHETLSDLEKMGKSARHLLDLINNILDLQDIEADALPIKQEPFSLEEQLDQLDTIVRSLARDKALDYEMTVAQAAEGSYIGDATQLKRALMCLLDNAVKYTPACGEVRFAVDCVERDGDARTLRFQVSDTGAGIDEAFLPKLFEPFAQEDNSATNRFGGSGVGLAVAKSVVERMGGRIEVASEKGNGSTFTVTLPLKLGKAAESAEAQDAPADLEGRKVMIVDDLEENAEIVADLLELEGVESERAENGQAALELFEKSPEKGFDAILMDLRMPIMDGWEAARRIRALDRPDAKAVPIIALSANAQEQDVRQSLAAGMNEHLVKPVDADKLYAALGRWIESAWEGGNAYD